MKPMYLKENNYFRCSRQEEILDEILNPGVYDKRIKPKSVNGIGEIDFSFKFLKNNSKGFAIKKKL